MLAGSDLCFIRESFSMTKEHLTIEHLLFCLRWVFPLIKAGWKKKNLLELSDVYQIMDEDRAQILGAKLER